MNDTKPVDHYAEAEKLMRQALDGTDNAVALVDAILANAAATLALTDATRRVADDEDKIAGVIDGEQRLLRVAVKP